MSLRAGPSEGDSMSEDEIFDFADISDDELLDDDADEVSVHGVNFAHECYLWAMLSR